MCAGTVRHVWKSDDNLESFVPSHRMGLYPGLELRTSAWQQFAEHSCQVVVALLLLLLDFLFWF